MFIKYIMLKMKPVLHLNFTKFRKALNALLPGENERSLTDLCIQ